MPVMSESEARRQFAFEVVQDLQEAGYLAYWAGGCVRDLLLGQEPADYDVATGATPEEVMRVLPYRAVTVGISFGVVRVLAPRRTGVEVEVATFRSDGAYIDGRRPESVVFSSPEMDASRRDFTINGMFWDPVAERLIDHVGGREDLERRVLRAIGDPSARFGEDKLRLLRAVRMAARFGLAIEPATEAAIRTMAPEVVGVSAERIAQELRRMLVHPSRTRAMGLALDLRVLAAVVPEAVRMRGIFQGKPMQPEGDLWDHTMLVLSLLPADPSFPLALAAFLHDVGKPSTRSLQYGRYSFHNHEQVGAGIAERVGRRLKLSNTERERITWLVQFHQYLGEAKRMREAKLKRVLAEPGIEELLALHRADALATTGDTQHIDYCHYYLQDEPSGPINPPTLLTGHDLARHGLKPGPQFKILLERAREAQLEGQIHSKREAIDWIDRELRAGGGRVSDSRPEPAPAPVSGGCDPSPAAVLVSGGLDSAILCVELLREFPRVVPIYIRSGLRWEDAEIDALRRFLVAVGDGRLERLVLLEEPIADVYGAHWSTIGEDIPGSETADEAVYLPGRNLLLTIKAAVWCRLRGIRKLALGSLGSNPFPDSTPEFFCNLEDLLNQAMGGGLRLIRPFAALGKADVLARGRHLPLHLTFSCIDPSDGRHCGRCNKCAERRKGFRDAGMTDLTSYATQDDALAQGVVLG
jgi:poly(A) polymerase